jgi:hypothetical protein
MGFPMFSRSDPGTASATSNVSAFTTDTFMNATGEVDVGSVGGMERGKIL